MQRWVEHYSELHARENKVIEEAPNAIKCLPVLDSEPTEEVKKVLGSLASGKAPGKDKMQAEILKCIKGDSFTKLYKIFCVCWK